ncbi:MAG: YabP/YqfC family sporulation protein [Clostridia bacterium]|nr:YabP/YqfC family sporulation protein [Clostridia bacterium]
MQKNPSTEKPFSLTIDRRARATLTGVTDVESFDENAVILHTHGGRLVLTGSGLHVSSLQLEEGRLLLEGTIDSAGYEGATRKGSFFRRALG